MRHTVTNAVDEPGISADDLFNCPEALLHVGNATEPAAQVCSKNSALTDKRREPQATQRGEGLRDSLQRKAQWLRCWEPWYSWRLFSRRSRPSLRFMPRESVANRTRSMRRAWTLAHEQSGTAAVEEAARGRGGAPRCRRLAASLRLPWRRSGA